LQAQLLGVAARGDGEDLHARHLGVGGGPPGDAERRGGLRGGAVHDLMHASPADAPDNRYELANTLRDLLGLASYALPAMVDDTVGGFDEGFAYGSDTDFSWRVTDAGYRIRGVPDAITMHDTGTPRRQLRRSYLYGKARVRLYRKHRARLRHILRNDPVVVVYPVFLLGLPLTFVYPFYPALLLIPAWRNRSDGAVGVLKNLTFGAGVLAELVDR